MFKYGPAPSGLLWGNKLLFAFLVGLVLVKYIFNALLVSNELCSMPLFLLSNEVWKKSGQVRWQKMTQYSEITPSLSERPILMETNSWWSKEKPYKWAKPPHFHGHYHQGFFQKGRGQVQFPCALKEAGERQVWSNQKQVMRPSGWSRAVALLDGVYRGGGKLLWVWVEPGRKR